MMSNCVALSWLSVGWIFHCYILTSLQSIYHLCLSLVSLLPHPPHPYTFHPPILHILFHQFLFRFSFFLSFSTACLPNSLPIFPFSHHSQKMLVMSESRLKIQITSGPEIRTNDQDTPLTDWRSLVITAPANPGLALVLCSSSSSSSDCLNNKSKCWLQTRHKYPCCTSTEALLAHSYLNLASWLDVVAGQKFENLIHQDDRNWHL